MSREGSVGDEDKDHDLSGWVIPTEKKGQKNARTDAALTVLVSMGLATAFFALFGGLRGAVTGAIVGAFWGAYRVWTGDA